MSASDSPGQAGRPTLEALVDEYASIGREYVESLRKAGIRFAPEHAHDTEIAQLREELRRRGAQMRNGGASVCIGWLSTPR